MERKKGRKWTPRNASLRNGNGRSPELEDPALDHCRDRAARADADWGDSAMEPGSRTRPAWRGHSDAAAGAVHRKAVYGDGIRSPGDLRGSVAASLPVRRDVVEAHPG